MRFTSAATILLTILVLPVGSSLAKTDPSDGDQPDEVGLPDGYWGLEQTGPILDKTLEVHLAPDLSHLSRVERQVADRLLEAGRIFQRLYERQNHGEAEQALERLEALNRESDGSEATRALLGLYWIFRGPIATTLDNRRLAFLPVAEEVPGRNVYPPALDREELDAVLEAYPEARRRLLHPRSIVRRATAPNLARDLEVLKTMPELAVLHPDLGERLERLARDPNPEAFYAAPYSVAYADELGEIYRLLWEASELVAEEDPDFSDYLGHRARDLLVDNYEAGDAAWISGSFGNLNAQIGSYETYDDELYGVKSFFGLSLLARDRERSERLAKAISGLQSIEDSLPYHLPKRIRQTIPVNVYNVIADFGDARTANTATILPNEEHLARKYGRTILLRYNIMTHPELFEQARDRFQAAVEPAFHDDLTLEGGFQHTLWHEIGHYLGVDRTDDGRSLEALRQYSNLMEELKSDLVSLFAAPMLAETGYYDARGLRSVYASGILRVLQVVRPRREQPYKTMQLMQWNWFLEHGVLAFDPGTERLRIDYERYPEAVKQLLQEVLAIQASGDPDRAAVFVERWGDWREDLHEVIAARLRESVRYRFRKIGYEALDSDH